METLEVQGIGSIGPEKLQRVSNGLHYADMVEQLPQLHLAAFTAPSS